MNKLWIFGCSFSSGYLDVPREKSYGNLIANELGMSISNLANPGRSNDMLFYELMKNVENISNNDKIIFQFSSFDRIGHFTSENEYSYFSTAGLPQLGIEHKIKEDPFKLFDKKQLEGLLEYIVEWHPKTWKFQIDNTFRLLDFLKDTKNVNYSILYMLNDYVKLNKHVVKLPINGNSDNLSMHDFVVDNKLTLSDDFPSKYQYYDSHPGISGHEKLKEILLNKL